MYYKDLLRYRHIWLGFAMLWIVIFHVPVNMTPYWFRAAGYGGVDICFFASGIGCYYSLTSDSDIGNFIKRRLRRIMPTYLVFIAVWLLAMYLVGDFNLQMAVGNILTLQHFSGKPDSFNWYVGAALLFYFLAPYFKIIVDKSSPLCKYLFPVFLFLCSVPFWNVGHLIITASRLPVFYIGMLFASICQQSQKITVRHILVAALSFFLGILLLLAFFKWLPQYLWSHALYWYPFIFLTPPLCMAISYLMIRTEKLKAMKPIVSLLSLCGNYSFEIYLVHMLLLSAIPFLIRNLNLSDYRIYIWVAGLVPLVVGCYLLRRFTLLFNQLFQNSISN